MTKVTVMFRNIETLELDINNPHVEWFVVEDENGRQKVFMYSHDVGKELE